MKAREGSVRAGANAMASRVVPDESVACADDSVFAKGDGRIGVHSTQLVAVTFLPRRPKSRLPRSDVMPVFASDNTSAIQLASRLIGCAGDS